MTVPAIKDIVHQRMQNATNRHLPAVNSLWLLHRPAPSQPSHLEDVTVVWQAMQFPGSRVLAWTIRKTHSWGSQEIQPTYHSHKRNEHPQKCTPLYEVSAQTHLKEFWALPSYCVVEVTRCLPLGDSVECGYNLDTPTCFTISYCKYVCGQKSRMTPRNSVGQRVPEL